MWFYLYVLSGTMTTGVPLDLVAPLLVVDASCDPLVLAVVATTEVSDASHCIKLHNQNETSIPKSPAQGIPGLSI